MTLSPKYFKLRAWRLSICFCLLLPAISANSQVILSSLFGDKLQLEIISPTFRMIKNK
jgi:hypothetical protein